LMNSGKSSMFSAVRTGSRRFLPLLALATVEFIWCVYLAASRRIPIGHDGFQYFYLKYYFFNDFIVNGELAQWLPYLTHGSPAAWWYAVQGGVFDPIMLFAARLFHFTSFLPIFYVLLFFEKLLLLIGTWLFASEHFRSRPAVFVVSAAVTATSIWYTQPWWNFHALLALPLLLFLVHRTICDFHWRWPIGMSLVLFLQTSGQLSYYLPMILLVIAAYAGLLLAHAEARTSLRSGFRFSAAGCAIYTAVNAGILIELLWLRRSSSDIQFAFSEREADGGVSLATFLNYAGNTDLRAWSQLFTGLTPHLDFTLFAGFLIPGLTVLAFGSQKMTQAQKLFAFLTVGTLLLTTASPLAILVYHFWPLARFFRHLALLSPVVKLFCICLAGATLDRLVCTPQLGFQKGRAFAVCAVLLPWALLLLTFAADPKKGDSFFEAIVLEGLPPQRPYTVSPLRLVLAGAVLVLTCTRLVELLRSTDSAARNRLAWAAAFLLLVDVSIYHSFEMLARTFKQSRQEAALFRFTQLPFANQRSETPESAGSLRFTAWKQPLSKTLGEHYWSQSLLFMVDSYQTTNRTVFWSTALDSLLRARFGDNVSKFVAANMALPTSDTALATIAGLREPKIRFAAQAIECADIASTAAVMSNPNYDGRVVLLTVSGAEKVADALPCDSRALAMAPPPISPAPSARVVGFSSNSAAFDVDNPAGRPLIMTYSDSWSDRWQARLNGTPAPVLRSDLAYKAVIVPSGKSRVEFRYKDRLEQFVFALQSLASASFLVFFGWLIRWRMAEPEAVRAKRVSGYFWSSTT
jgi:hypothetical protein